MTDEQLLAVIATATDDNLRVRAQNALTLSRAQRAFDAQLWGR
jgi:hypothetical protein